MNANALDENRLSEKEWAEIRVIAHQLYRENRFEGNQLRCAVAAFLIWINEKAAVIESETISEMVH